MNSKKGNGVGDWAAVLASQGLVQEHLFLV